MAVRKYRNVPIEVDGVRFDSKKEARRWGELKLLERAGKIQGLQRQHVFRIDVKGAPVCKFIADFTYTAAGDVFTVEDVKSPATRKNPVYRLKIKLLEAVYGHRVSEV